MRLIDISSPNKLKFVEVRDPSVVRYAILSHVWNKPDGNDAFTPEPTFQDLSSAMKDSLALPENVPMWDKLRGFIRTASESGFSLIWADMCCIDKKNSAEASEAIASMYQWYLCAEVCYAYLQDVPYPSHEPDTLSPPPSAQFSQSIWFKRGWTLQELLASETLIFLSSDWKILGTKLGLSQIVHDITSIDVRVLTQECNLDEVSVACRMSWAAHRTTERPEDRAYSLMGLFGVRIPVLYGEGESAFVRLQEEILRRIPDPTLLAWGQPHRLSDLPLDISVPGHGGEAAIHVRAHPRERVSPESDADSGCLLAKSPDDFLSKAHLTRTTSRDFGPISIAPSRTVLRGGGPYRQNIIPFGMFQMDTPLVRLEKRTAASSQLEAKGTAPHPYYLVPLGCQTERAEDVALLLCPGTPSSAPRSGKWTSGHQYWTIGDGSENSIDSTSAHRCRIVTLPSRYLAAGLRDKLLRRSWDDALAKAPYQEVFLPLSAPMDYWNARRIRRADVTEALLRGHQGHFGMRLSGWCGSAMEEAGFIFDEQVRGRNPAYKLTLLPPQGHTLFVKEGGQDVAVQAFEITFASCPGPHTRTSQNEVFSLVGSIDISTHSDVDHSPTTSTIASTERQRCSSCHAAATDHLGTPGSWVFQRGVAIRKVQCLVGLPQEEFSADYAEDDYYGADDSATDDNTVDGGGGATDNAAENNTRSSFALLVRLRALSSTPQEAKPAPQDYLLEIEFYPSEAEPVVPGTSAVSFLERRGDMSPSGRSARSMH